MWINIFVKLYVCVPYESSVPQRSEYDFGFSESRVMVVVNYYVGFRRESTSSARSASTFNSGTISPDQGRYIMICIFKNIIIGERRCYSTVKLPCSFRGPSWILNSHHL